MKILKMILWMITINRIYVLNPEPRADYDKT